jgi:hypothetical protein
MHSMIHTMAFIAAFLGNSCRTRQYLPNGKEGFFVRRVMPGVCEESQQEACQDLRTGEKGKGEEIAWMHRYIAISLYSDTCHIAYGIAIIASLLFA